MDVKERYVKLQKKYGLPSYDDMVRDFDIDLIGKDENVMREVQKKMFDKIDFFARTLEALVQPDSTYANMKEASSLNVSEQQLAKRLFAELMHIARAFTINSLEYNEEEFARFISSLNDKWQKIKPELKVILVSLKEAWKKQKDIEEDKGYFG